MGTSIACDVVILPSSELSDKAVAMSKTLKPLGSLFSLEVGKYYPHVSVYMLQLKTDDISKAKKLLADIAVKTNKLTLTATRYHQTHNYFDAEYEKTEELASLQMAVVETLNPIRDGVREKDKPRMTEATGLALENFKKYGWSSIGELYRPHLTLTRFINEQQNPEHDLPNFTEFSSQFPKLGLFEMGDNGTAVHKIAEFELKSNNE